MKTAGLVVDFYDDPSGRVLKEYFPSADRLPSIVKTAHILSPEERDVLRDEAYALIIQNEGKVLRKFACVDPGNTFLSALYLIKNHQSLPPEAVKVAAANINEACEKFGLKVPSMLKVAARTGLQRTRDPMQQPLVGDEADWAQRTNLVSVRAGNDAGRVIPTVNQMKTASVCCVGGGEVLTDDSRNISTKMKQPDLQNKKGVKLKPTSPVLDPGAHPRVIDLSTSTVAPTLEKKSHSRYALPGKYPLDSYADVTKAVSYFTENYPQFSPSERHDYCVKTAARAGELGIQVPELLQRYGSTEYAPDVEAHLANRKACCPDEFRPVYQTLKEKRSSIHPEVFAHLLKDADEASGLSHCWGGHVADPWAATFGGNSAKEKVASYVWESHMGEKVTGDQLLSLARQKEALREKFDNPLVEGFIQDPITVFDSLPNDTKTILARMAQ